MVEPLSLAASVNALITGVKNLLDHKAASQFSTQLIELLKLSQEIQEQHRSLEEKIEQSERENQDLRRRIQKLENPESGQKGESREHRMEELHEQILLEIAKRPDELDKSDLEQIFQLPALQVSHAINVLYERELLAIEPGDFTPSQRATGYLAQHGLLSVPQVSNPTTEELSDDELKVLKALAMQPNGSSMQFIMGTSRMSLAKAQAVYLDLQQRGLVKRVVKTSRSRDPANISPEGLAFLNKRGMLDDL